MGKVTTYTYNELGKVESVTDSMNHRTEFTYNSRGQNTAVRDAANNTSSATYDLLGNVTRLAGPLGGATNYTYDDMGRLTSESTVSGGTKSYEYNELSVRKKITNARGQIRQIFYDSMGRITGFTSPEGAVSYTYDASGNVLTVSDSHGTVTRTYDALNRVSSYTDTYGKVIRYEYDAVGNLTKIQPMITVSFIWFLHILKEKRSYAMLPSFLSVICNFISLVLGISLCRSFPPPLSAETERECFRRLKAEGDENARALLIEHNLRLVSHIVRKYYGSAQNADELVSIGTLGLIKAIDSFRPELGAKFATYAAKCIQNEILMLFRSQKKLTNEVSINETIDVDRDGNPLTYLDVISSEDTIAEDLDLKTHTEHAMTLLREALDARERKILVLRYGLSGKAPMTQREVSELLGISRSYVSRIEKKALSTLRARFGDQIPDFDT